MKPKIIVIVGPTAVGKTSLGIDIAKQLNGEVISGDSMQIYKGLDIGTAKVTKEEMQDIPHHLIDEINVHEPYSVADFQREAQQRIQDICARGKVPVIVGGTGLYIESLLYNVSHGGESPQNPAFREEQNRLADEKGNRYLWKTLYRLDPKAAESIHENNRRRIIRALEVIHETGKPYSSLQDEKKTKEPFYDAQIIGLTTDRALLYERINQRVDIMMETGLLQEAKWLWEQVEPTVQSAKGIGYKELFPYFEGQVSLGEAVEQIKQNSRRYAKRQLTWFRNRFESVSWWDLVQQPESETALMEEVKNFLQTE